MPDGRRTGGNSESVDNYLKAILFLGGAEERRVTSSALADRLDVAPASVTNMLQKLAGAAVPMVEYERHRGVRLSAPGKRRALEVVRHHRLIETFLFEILDYPIEEVHDEGSGWSTSSQSGSRRGLRRSWAIRRAIRMGMRFLR